MKILRCAATVNSQSEKSGYQSTHNLSSAKSREATSDGHKIKPRAQLRCFINLLTVVLSEQLEIGVSSGYAELNPAQLSDLLDLEQWFVTSEQEIAEVSANGQSELSLVREISRKHLVWALKELLQSEFGDLPSDNASILSFIQTLPVSKKMELAASAQEKVRNSELSSENKSYLQRQLRTQLGEMAKLQMPSFEFSPNESLALAQIYPDDKVRQRIFNYQLFADDFPSLIDSVYSHYLAWPDDRSLTELNNTTLLRDQLDVLELGDTIVEFSYPKYKWQTQMMLRLYRKSIGLQPNGFAEGYDITVLSLPDGFADHAEQLEIWQKEFGAQTINTNPHTTDPLAQLIKIPSTSNVTVDQITDTIPKIMQIGGTSLLQSLDAKVQARVDELTSQLLPIATQFSEQLFAFDAGYWADRFRNAIAAVLLHTEHAEEYEWLDAEFVDRIVAGEVDFDDFANLIGEQFVIDSECGQIVIGGDASHDLSIVDTVTATDGTMDIEWVNFSDGRSMLKKCPNPHCHQRLLDPCLESCPSCGISISGMREAFEERDLAGYINSYNNKHGISSSLSDYSHNENSVLDRFFESLLGGVGGIFSFIWQ